MMWSWSSFKQGIYVNWLPPAFSKLSLISSFISSKVSIQSDEKAGAITANFFFPICLFVSHVTVT